MLDFAQYNTIAWLLTLFIGLGGWLLVQREFAHRGRREAELREREGRLRGAMYASVDGVFMLRALRDATGAVSDFEVLDVNPTGAALLRQSRESILGARTSSGAPLRCNNAMFADYVQVMETNTAMVSEMRVSPRRFATTWLWHQAVPVEGGIAVTIRDIAARKKEEENLRRASLTDELTGLYNRRGFLTLAEQQLRVARRQGRDLVLFFADLDGFKQVNDRFGHAAGDTSLKAMANLLRGAVRDSDIVARLGGDEFTLLALDGDANAASVIRRRINQRVAALNARNELAAPLSVSIGHVRVSASQLKSLEELLASADKLLYKSKAQRLESFASRTQRVESVASTAQRVESVSSKASTISPSVLPSSSLRHHGRASSSLLNVRTT